jgi:hypothetical protein
MLSLRLPLKIHEGWGEVGVGLVGQMRHQLVLLAACRSCVLMAHLEGLVPGLLVVQGLETDVSHVRPTDALGDPAAL